MRTANFCAPKTLTCATPSRVESWRASRVSAYSSTSDGGSVAEHSARNMIGDVGRVDLAQGGRLGQRRAADCGSAAEIADCTSCAAPSILRSSANCMVMLVVPCVLDEVIESMPGMVENWFSSGVATADAMVSGSAPGRLADTSMVGKSTLGSSLTGKRGIAEDAEDHQRRHQQRRHHRPFDEELRNVHCESALSGDRLRGRAAARGGAAGVVASAVAPRFRGAARHLAAGKTRSWPSVITLSPGFSLPWIASLMPSSNSTFTGTLLGHAVLHDIDVTAIGPGIDGFARHHHGIGDFAPAPRRHPPAGPAPARCRRWRRWRAVRSCRSCRHGVADEIDRRRDVLAAPRVMQVDGRRSGRLPFARAWMRGRSVCGRRTKLHRLDCVMSTSGRGAVLAAGGRP